MSNPKITIEDYEIDICSIDVYAIISGAWGDTCFRLEISQKVCEEWFNDTGKNEGQDDEGETWEVPFEPYMETQFYQDEALDLVKYVIKHHYKLVEKK